MTAISKTDKACRPFKSDQLNLEKVAVIASMGLTDEEIAIILDISPRTLNYWKKTNPGFLQSLNRGQLKADFQITQSLYQKAKNGDTTAQIFWLKNRRPDLWREKSQLEFSGQVGAPDNKLIVEVVHVSAEVKK